MSTQETPREQQRDHSTVSVDYDVLDELHERKRREDTLNDVIRRALKESREQ